MRKDKGKTRVKVDTRQQQNSHTSNNSSHSPPPECQRDDDHLIINVSNGDPPSIATEPNHPDEGRRPASGAAFVMIENFTRPELRSRPTGGVLSNLLKLYPRRRYSRPRYRRRRGIMPVYQNLSTGCLAIPCQRRASNGDTHSLYSAISDEESFTDINGSSLQLDEKLRITEAVADILERQEFLLRLGKMLMHCGGPSHRIESVLETTSEALGVDAEFVFIPGLLMVTFGDQDTHTSETHLIKCVPDWYLGKLEEVNEVVRAVLKKQMTAHEALPRLEEIEQEPDMFGNIGLAISFMLSGAFAAATLFKGSWLDASVGAFTGLIVGVLLILASHNRNYGNVYEVSSSILVAFIARSFHRFVCFQTVVLAAAVILLPGLQLTISIIELSSRHIVAGTVRMMYALMYALFLGFGFSIGAALWNSIEAIMHWKSVDSAAICHSPLEWYWLVILFPPLACALAVSLRATPKQWPVIVAVSAVAYMASLLSANITTMPANGSAAIAAFMCGLTGNLYSRFTHRAAYVPILCAILLLVPGSLGVKGTLLLLTDDLTHGTNFAFQMIIISLAITVGLFMSTLVVYPTGRKHSSLFTF
ncbi:uncharacterized protein VTP21DRAFT_3873 [Calcarisporiella thermophila]|uniref:uncharacterized protein n=1 Tax=Calcarisporiella thermophila TaxID=911321 RepID=UPI003743401E